MMTINGKTIEGFNYACKKCNRIWFVNALTDEEKQYKTDIKTNLNSFIKNRGRYPNLCHCGLRFPNWLEELKS